MQNRLSGTIKQLAFVFLALALLAVLAQVGVGYAAPGFQGTVPPPPGGTPVPPTPAPLPQGLGGPCCLPGIAFDSTRDGNLEIYVMRSDGTAVTRLTVNPAIDQDPAPSRDGTRIAFQSTRDDPNVSTCGQAGQEVRRLIRDFGNDLGGLRALCAQPTRRSLKSRLDASGYKNLF